MADVAKITIKVDSREVTAANKDLDHLKNASTSAVSAVAGLEKAVAGLGAAFSMYKLGEMIKETTLLAARHETLGVALQAVGRNAGYTSGELERYTSALQANGITMIESRQSAVRLMAAHIDLAHAAKIGRAAQDLAVVGGINSSEAFDRLVQAIQKGNVHMLHGLGIAITYESAYNRVAKSMNRTVSSLTDYEKAQIRMNAVLDYAKTLEGTYEAAMTTAGKQLYSLKRYVEDTQVKLGEAFGPALIVLVRAATNALLDLQGAIKDAQTTGEFQAMARGLASVASVITTVVRWIWNMRDALSVVMRLYVGVKIGSLLSSWISLWISKVQSIGKAIAAQGLYEVMINKVTAALVRQAVAERAVGLAQSTRRVNTAGVAVGATATTIGTAAVAGGSTGAAVGAVTGPGVVATAAIGAGLAVIVALLPEIISMFSAADNEILDMSAHMKDLRKDTDEVNTSLVDLGKSVTDSGERLAILTRQHAILKAIIEKKVDKQTYFMSPNDRAQLVAAQQRLDDYRAAYSRLTETQRKHAEAQSGLRLVDYIKVEEASIAKLQERYAAIKTLSAEKEEFEKQLGAKGERTKGRAAGKSDEEKQIEDVERLIESLQKEVAVVGLKGVALKEVNAQLLLEKGFREGQPEAVAKYLAELKELTTDSDRATAAMERMKQGIAAEGAVLTNAKALIADAALATSGATDESIRYAKYMEALNIVLNTTEHNYSPEQIAKLRAYGEAMSSASLGAAKLENALQREADQMNKQSLNRGDDVTKRLAHLAEVHGKTARLSTQAWKDAYYKIRLEGNDATGYLMRGAETAADRIAQGFADMATGVQTSFREMAAGILKEVARMMAQRAVANLLGMFLQWAFTPSTPTTTTAPYAWGTSSSAVATGMSSSYESVGGLMRVGDSKSSRSNPISIVNNISTGGKSEGGEATTEEQIVQGKMLGKLLQARIQEVLMKEQLPGGILYAR